MYTVFMSQRGPRAVVVVLSDDERGELSRWARGAASPRLAERARIVLACSDGASNASVAAECGVSSATVGKWRSRFAVRGLARLKDEPRPGRRKSELVLTEPELAQLTRGALRAAAGPLPSRPGPGAVRCVDGAA